MLVQLVSSIILVAGVLKEFLKSQLFNCGEKFTCRRFLPKRRYYLSYLVAWSSTWFCKTVRKLPGEQRYPDLCNFSIMAKSAGSATRLLEPWLCHTTLGKLFDLCVSFTICNTRLIMLRSWDCGEDVRS